LPLTPFARPLLSLCAAPGRDTLQPYVGFHAALRSACITYVNKLEDRARGLLQHHLDAATGADPSRVASGQAVRRVSTCRHPPA
jgi:hypothetical protein